MKKLSLLIPWLLFGLLVTPAHAQFPAATVERVQASYLIAFGRPASAGEVAYWARQNPASVGALVNDHRYYLSRDAGTHRATIVRAYVDAMGRNPTEAEINYWFRGNDTYAQLMQNHINWLRGNPAEYEKVIRRSYQFALHRQPNAAEVRYWKSQGVMSYAMLVACHEDWQRRNGGSSAHGGRVSIAANSSVLATLAVSPAVGREARAAAGVIPAGAGNVIAAGGGNVIAAGGGNVIAAGGGNVIAAGGGNVIAAGGGNLRPAN